MKLETPDVKSLTSEEFEKKAFLVDARTAQIFFRDKMYTDDGRLRVMAQEYMSNARDAHREMGKSDTPIEVTLPTTLAPEYIVRDFGPGISEERIDKVFRIYGKSTKNESDIENGGFGLGAKCAFSYASSFALTTIHKGIKYVYSGYIDDEAMNQLILMHKGPSEEPDGTEVRIPIKSEDISRFTKWVHEVTHHWEPRPVFKGREAAYLSLPEPLARGTGWHIHRAQGLSYIDSLPGIWVLADGIPYRVPPDDAKRCGGEIAEVSQLLNATHRSLILTYKVGELSIYPNREFLYYGERTKRALLTRVRTFKQELTAGFSAELLAAKNPVEAVGLWNRSSDLAGVIKGIMRPVYNGVDIAASVLLQNAGVTATVAHVDFVGGRLAVRDERKESSMVLSDLLSSAPERRTRWYVIDSSNGVPSWKFVKQSMRMDGIGYVGVLTIDNQELANKYLLTPDNLRAARFRTIKREVKDKTSVRSGKKEAVFVRFIDVRATFPRVGDTKNLHKIPPTGARKRVGFAELSSTLFVTRDPNGAGWMFDSKVHDYDVFANMVSLTEAIKEGLLSKNPELRTRYLGVWEPRFSSNFKGNAKAYTVEDSLATMRSELAKAQLSDVMRLVQCGFLSWEVKAPSRWFWDISDEISYIDAVVKNVTSALVASKKYSKEFLRYARHYMRCIGTPTDKSSTARRLEDLYAPVMGDAGYARLKEAVDTLNEVGREFAFLFDKMPETPYLLEAVAFSGSDSRQFGAPKNLPEFVGCLIGDRHVPSLRFSHINNPQEHTSNA